MTTLSLRHHGADTNVPLGRYRMTITTDRGHNENTTTITAPHTLGSLAAGLTVVYNLPGNVVDLVITPE